MQGDADVTEGPFSGVEIHMEMDIGYGVEMDGNGAHFVKMLWIGLDLG